MEIVVDLPKEKHLRDSLAERSDAEAARIKRYLAMPDLSRTPDSPLFEMVQKVKALPNFKNFDNISIPEIVPTSILFDLFNFPTDHPARSKGDTYFVDEENALRTHDTVFWYYYLQQPEIRARIAEGEAMGALCYGKVYRKDEIDRRHMNIFHQMGGWYIQPDVKGQLTLNDLKNVLIEIVEAIYGKDTEYRFLDDTFPYTDPSLQIEVKLNDQWIEIMGGGIPRKNVLTKLGLEGYNGWAFGFGLERLAIISCELPDIRLLWSKDERVKRQFKLGQKYQEVSRYPSITRDISFVVPHNFTPNNYFDLIRDVGGELVEEVELLDKYENAAKFGEGQVSYTYRITYRSLERTLTSEEVEPLQQKIEAETVRQFEAKIR